MPPAVKGRLPVNDGPDAAISIDGRYSSRLEETRVAPIVWLPYASRLCEASAVFFFFKSAKLSFPALRPAPTGFLLVKFGVIFMCLPFRDSTFCGTAGFLDFLACSHK